MSDKTRSEQKSAGRRKAIKKIGVAGGLAATVTSLPKTWTKPIVESVMLPAHAQTSLLSLFFSSTIISASAPDRQRWYANLIDLVTPKAQAQNGATTHSACATINGSQVEVTWQNPKNSRRHRGVLNANGSDGTLTEIANAGGGCGEPGNTHAARILSITDDTVTVSIDRNESNEPYILTIPRGTACNFPPLDGNCGE